MKITEVKATHFSIPARKEPPHSPWMEHIGQQIVVQVETDQGLRGWGESFALVAPGAVCQFTHEWLRPLLLGENPLNPEALWEKIEKAALLCGISGIAAFAISGVEIALWDIKGRYEARLLKKRVPGEA